MCFFANTYFQLLRCQSELVEDGFHYYRPASTGLPAGRQAQLDNFILAFFCYLQQNIFLEKAKYFMVIRVCPKIYISFFYFKNN
jgi:hypothetical protein